MKIYVGKYIYFVDLNMHLAWVFIEIFQRHPLLVMVHSLEILPCLSQEASIEVRTCSPSTTSPITLLYPSRYEASPKVTKNSEPFEWVPSLAVWSRIAPGTGSWMISLRCLACPAAISCALLPKRLACRPSNT